MIQNNKLSPEQYTQNFADIHPPFDTAEGALIEANRCLFCYDAPCTKSCPTSIDIPTFIKQIATENIKGSAKTIFDSNIMGAGCSRVCPVEKLCEGACVFNLLHEQPISIARLQRYATEPAIANQWKLYQAPAPNNKKVAVVGAGPAGLACAHALALQGIQVTIFEKEAKGGGLMTYGVAAYKVTPEFCEAEVNFITAVGNIHIEYNQELGKNLNLTTLQQNYDAIFLGIGVGLARQLNIEGEHLQGVEDAISFIYNLRTNPYNQINIGNKVAVIGMGMTAIDAATQAKRLGAEQVTLIYRRTETEKPCTNAELDIAKLDGCNIIWLSAPLQIKGNAEGKVTHLICSQMELSQPDETGKRTVTPTTKTIELEVDMVIKAVGQMPFEDLITQHTIHHQHGKPIIQPNGATSLKGVFSGGDCVNGGKEVVDAVQAGKNAAKGILEYLGGC